MNFIYTRRIIFLILFLGCVAGSLQAQVPLTLLKDLNTEPGLGGSRPREIVAMNNMLYFAGDALWRSDGTPMGTKRVREIINNDGPIDPFMLTPGQNSIYFMAWSTNSQQLWTSDGSSNGTKPVNAAFDGFFSHVDTMVTVNNTAFLFISFDNRVELWQSDGTTEGTKLVKQIWQNNYISFPYYWLKTKLIVWNGSVYFMVYDADGNGRFWKTDGTDAGTLLVKSDIKVEESIVFNNALYFREAGSRFWSTDGTPEGTSIFSFTPGVGPFSPEKFAIAGNTLYFVASNELWKTDGTPLGTVRVKTGLFDFGSLCGVGSNLYFTANDGTNGQELWRSDGTEAGTLMVYETYSGSYAYSIRDLTMSGGNLFFAITYLDGLYKFDGTTTTQIISEGVDEPTSLISFNNILYFASRRYKVGTTTHHPELWRSDGSELGTYMLTGTEPTTASASPYGFTITSNALYFNAHALGDWSLHVTDGTTEGTTYLKPSGSEIVLMENTNTVLFAINDELWKSDGTLAGTSLVKDIRPGVDGQPPVNLIGIDNIVYLTANDGSIGRELWKTDGTPEGTMLVKDINPGSASSMGSQVISFKGQLFFNADDGTNGSELWKTDGTEAGTILFKEIAAGATSGNPRFFAAGDDILFFSAYQPSTGYQLWKTDGTEAGTGIVKLISQQIYFIYGVWKNIVYFGAADPASGLELWRSDGTETGTYLLKDINAGPSDSNIFGITDANGTLFFSASDGIHGAELWKSDGTAQGTMLVQDIFEGPHSSGIQSFAVINDDLYFIAKDNTHGYEVWKTDGDDCGAQRLTDNLNLIPKKLAHIGQRLVVVASNEEYGEELYYYDITNNPPERLPQTIAFDLPEDVRYGDVLVLEASTVSSTPVTFSSSDDAVGSITMQILTIHKPGSVTLTAHHAGDNLYCPAMPVANTLNVGKGVQTISFETITGGTEGTELTLVATASSGLPVVFTTTGSDISVMNNTAQLLEPGPTTIEAQQEGNEYYLPAATVSQTFCINPKTPVATIIDSEAYTLQSSNDNGNQWYRDAGLISGETAKTMTAEVSGVYTVITTIDGCGSEMSAPLEVIILGTEEEDSEFIAFPNPFHEILTVETRKSGVEVQLFNALGQKKDLRRVNHGTIIIDTKNYSPGVYFLLIRDGDSVRIKKLVKA